MQEAAVVLSVLRERGRKGLPFTQLYRQLLNKDLYLLFVDRTTGRHQRKRTCVKRYWGISLLILIRWPLAWAGVATTDACGPWCGGWSRGGWAVRGHAGAHPGRNARAWVVR